MAPLPRQAFEQTRQSPETSGRKTGPSKKVARPQGGNEGHESAYRWDYEKVRLSMSKTSIMGLVLGLLFLGVLFFIIGFLAAVATLKSDEKQRAPQSAWQASNPFLQQGQDHQGGHGGKKPGYTAGAVGASLLGEALHKPLEKIAGAASSVIPQPLKPFARYGVGSARSEARSVGRDINPFYPRHRTAAPEQPPSGIPPQYAIPQVQPQAYGTPPVPAGYQQPPAPFPERQGGYQGYAPMQQQAQPYYPPPQPMIVSQPQMVQAPYSQPPYPQYPQQMPLQQGYWR